MLRTRSMRRPALPLSDPAPIEGKTIHPEEK